MEFWIVLAVSSIFNIMVGYWCYRCAQRTEHALQDLQTSNRSAAEWSHSTATQSTHIKANVRYLVEYLEARFGHSDELRRQALLQQVRREAMSEKPTPIESLIVTPHTPVPPPWIGDQAMQIMRATRRHK